MTEEELDFLTDEELAALTVPRDPFWTRKSITETRHLWRLTFLAAGLLGLGAWIFLQRPSMLVLLGILGLAAALLEFALWCEFCPECDYAVFRSDAFCECGRLLRPELVKTPDADSVNLDTILDHEEPFVNLVGLVFLIAIKDKASEVIFEPTETEFKLHLCVDGQFYEMVPPPAEWQRPVCTTLKLFAGMDCWRYDQPQQGNMRFRIQDWTVEGIAEARPQQLGETIAIRFPENQIAQPPDFVLQGQ